MIDDLPVYPEMRDSGVAWLGEVPAHWDVQSLGSCIKTRSERGAPDLPLLSVLREKGVVLRSSLAEGENHNFVPDDLSNYKVARQNDLVINKMKAWQGSLGLAPCDGICSPAYYVFQLDIADRRYAERLFRSRDYVAAFARSSDGVRIGQWDLSIPAMKRIPVAVPPPAEQAAVVRFLAHADRKISGYIAAKLKLVRLLEEAKAAITQRAVTRGLDAAARMKVTCVPWLGDIPEHWRVVPIKYLTTLKRGKFTHRPRNDPALYDGDYPFIQTGEVARAQKFIEGYRQTLNEKGRAVSASFPAGTLVMTIAGNIGDVAILRFDAYFPDSIVGFVPDANSMDRDFLYLLFQALKDEFISDAPVNTQGNLNVERVGGKKIPVPPIPEQIAIVAAIESETATLDKAIATARAEIDLLREYRARLIADVVTGKRDVRSAAAALPEVADEAPLADMLAEEDDDAEDAAEDVEAA